MENNLMDSVFKVRIIRKNTTVQLVIPFAVLLLLLKAF